MYRTESELITIVGEKRCDRPMSQDPREAATNTVGEPRCPMCGTTPFIPNEVHGHVACFQCGQTVEACCNGDIG